MSMRRLIRDWFEWMGASLYADRPADFITPDNDE